MPLARIPSTWPASLAFLWLGFWSPGVQAAGVLEFVESRLIAREGETHDILVVRSGSATGEATVVLNVSLGGTARLGTDFDVDLPFGVIRIPDGEYAARARVDIPQNGTVQGTRHAVFTLANPVGATLGRETSLLLQIQDDETPAASLRIAGAPVRRVTAGEELPIEVTREGLAAETLVATLFGVPGTAALGADYSDLATALEFAPGQAVAGATLSTIAATAPRSPRTLSLVLANVSPAGRAAFSGIGPLVVIENPPGERAGEFSLFAAVTEVSESSGAVVLTVDRNRGSTGPASVNWVTVAATGSAAAIPGRDFVAATGTLEFAEGETRKTFEVALVDDDEVRRDRRRFNVALANPSALAGLDPEGRQVTIIILENDGDPKQSCRGFCDCFIATAAWGSWMDPHVVSLRRFRDDVLMQSAPGRAFVAFYYRQSPAFARFIGQHELLRTATRATLAPIVFAVDRPAAAGGLLLLCALMLANLRRRARRTRAS
jgi:mRNA-degrading endonuclease toxin of MazEF toxin-antitoxin module